MLEFKQNDTYKLDYFIHGNELIRIYVHSQTGLIGTYIHTFVTISVADDNKIVVVIVVVGNKKEEMTMLSL